MPLLFEDGSACVSGLRRGNRVRLSRDSLTKSDGSCFSAEIDEHGVEVRDEQVDLSNSSKNLTN